MAFAHRHWRLLAFLGFGFGPFLPSIIAMREFLLADNALGFTPFALVAALYIFWLRAHSEQAPKSRDILVDLFLIGPLVLIAFFILFVTPASLSWYFWLNRMDLAALAPWAMAVALATIGYQQVLRTWPTWLLLVLVWPYPAVWLQRLLTDVFVSATAWTGQFVVAFARLPYATDRADPQVFTTTHLPEEENFTLVVGQLCSGTSVTIGFLVVGAGLVLMTQGSASRRWWWLLAGAVLAFGTNLVRVAVLLIVATNGSRELAMEVVHPILGLVFFGLVVLVMLLLLRPFGLRFRPVPRGRRLVWEPSPGGGKALRVVWALMAGAALGIGAGVVQAQAFDFIGVGDGAPTVSVESERGIIPEVPGWELEHETEISWTDLFGRTSRGDVFSYLQPGYQEGDAVIGVQTIVTEDKATLDRYSLEQCIEFHRRDLEARRAVDLGHGLTGYILHDTYEGIPSSVLYWVMPVTVDGDLFHARIALFGDIEDPTSYAGLEAVTREGSAPAVRFGQALETAMDTLPSGEDDPRREQVDRDLVAMALALVAVMVEDGGAGSAPDEPADADASAVTSTRVR